MALATTRPQIGRLQSLDVMRGIVMVLMAIDHVRVYSGVPAGGPTPAVFFTRWITHFVAPGFAFLAGTAAFLHGRKLVDRGALARYLVTRGAFLILLELTVIRVAWTFNFDYAHYLLAGVIWMLGACMILLAALIWLPTGVIAALGLLVIFGQSLFGPVVERLPRLLGALLYSGGDEVQLGSVGPVLAVLYSIVPWIGVMAAGYAFGAVMTRDPAERRRICATIGLSAIALFLILRGLDGYGDPHHWKNAAGSAAPALLRFLNTSKYPASPLFLLMTLGPLIALLPLAERLRGAAASVLSLFGRVPLFYYLLHIPLIHLAALVVSLIREHHIDPWLIANHPMMPPPVPEGYRWPLPLLYLVFALVIAILYFPCRWYADAKANRPRKWMRYV
jgi:uncharacterized membrane protein